MKKCWLVLLAVLFLGLFVNPVRMGAEEAETWKDKRGAERFAPLDWLIGEWQGYGQFAERVTYIHKSYSYDVAGMFFVERTLDMFPPEEVSTDFEIHQDFTVFYRLNESGALRARSFYVESFVSSSAVRIENDGSRMVVESEEVENGPPGMRARYTIDRKGDDQYAATFEVAWPGKDFSLYEELEMKRVH